MHSIQNFKKKIVFWGRPGHDKKRYNNVSRAMPRILSFWEREWKRKYVVVRDINFSLFDILELIYFSTVRTKRWMNIWISSRSSISRRGINNFISLENFKTKGRLHYYCWWALWGRGEGGGGERGGREIYCSETTQKSLIGSGYSNATNLKFRHFKPWTLILV